MAILTLTTAVTGPVRAVEFRAVEHVSRPFAVDVRVLLEDAALDLSAIVGRPATFHALAGHAHVAGGGERAWSGLLTHAEQAHALPVASGQAGRSTYQFRLAPHLYGMTQRRNNRIFQHLSIPDIVEGLLHEWTIAHEWHIQRRLYPRLEYKVQYAETDHTFVSRLLEEAGIAYTFAWIKGESVMRLSDSLERSEPRSGAPLPYIESPNEAAERELVTKVSIARETRPGAVTMRDYDPWHPNVELFARAEIRGDESRLEQFHHTAGWFRAETGKPQATPVADDRSFTRHDPAHGSHLAETMLRSERVGAHPIELQSNAYDLAPGTIFSVELHPHHALPASRRLLVIATLLDAGLQGEWSLSATAIPADEPYHPPRENPKPRIHGVQSARVVGPAGQEIHTDENGRVRIELPWDRQSHRDERASCWVRVAEGWSGPGYGQMDLPRIGQEVLVSFLGGDPDFPLVAGRVFNAVEQVPYRLPVHATRSAWKSHSTPGSSGFNEIMYEDLAGQELVWQQAQKDRTRAVENDEQATVGHDRRRLVKHDEDERTEAYRRRRVDGHADSVLVQDRRERIEHDSHLMINGGRRELVRGKESVTVVGSRRERVRGRVAVRTAKRTHVIGKDIVGEAAIDVTLRGPGGFVRIDSSGVTITGTLVKINVTGTPGSGPGSHPEAPEEPVEDGAPSITRLRWSKPKVPVGHEVKAIFRVKHFKGNETALVKVFEHDADGSKKQIDEVSVPVGKTDGDVKVKWVRTPEQAEGDLQEDADEGDIGPLEYRFEVEAGALRGDGESGPLWLTNTVVVEVKDGDRPGKDGTKVTLTTVEGKKTKTSKGGKATFQDVLVGTIQVEIRKPRN